MFGGDILHGLYMSCKENSSTQPYTFWITHSEADICIPAADRIQTAASFYLKKLSNMLCWCGGFVSLFVCKFYKFLNFNILFITKLDKEKNQCTRQKNWRTEHSKGNKTVPGKVATTCTEDRHKQTTKTNTTI